MKKCWAQNPDDRPTFEEIQSELKKMSDPLKEQQNIYKNWFE